MVLNVKVVSMFISLEPPESALLKTTKAHEPRNAPADSSSLSLQMPKPSNSKNCCSSSSSMLRMAQMLG
jgi:hypothetical protein